LGYLHYSESKRNLAAQSKIRTASWDEQP
jgi:hypothetical protein